MVNILMTAVDECLSTLGLSSELVQFGGQADMTEVHESYLGHSWAPGSHQKTLFGITADGVWEALPIGAFWSKNGTPQYEVEPKPLSELANSDMVFFLLVGDNQEYEVQEWTATLYTINESAEVWHPRAFEKAKKKAVKTAFDGRSIETLKRFFEETSSLERPWVNFYTPNYHVMGSRQPMSSVVTVDANGISIEPAEGYGIKDVDIYIHEYHTHSTDYVDVILVPRMVDVAAWNLKRFTKWFKTVK